MIEIDVSDLLITCQHIIAELPAVIDKTLDEIGQIGQRSAASSTLYKGNGHLRKSIKLLKDGELAKTLIADTSYSGYVEFGNNQSGDRIYAKGKALRFVIDGETIFRKSVKAHGPIPFMGQAREQMILQAPQIIRDNIDALMSKGR